MRKTFVTLLVAAIFMLSAATVSSMADTQTMTNAEFAELVVKTLGIELPAGSEDLPRLEYFEVMSNVLAVNGIDDFIGKEADKMVSFGGFVTVVYEIAGGPPGANLKRKLAYLVTHAEVPFQNLDSTLTLAEAANILNIPACATLMAEGYSSRELLARGNPNTRGEGAPSFKLEETTPAPIVTAASPT